MRRNIVFALWSIAVAAVLSSLASAQQIGAASSASSPPPPPPPKPNPTGGSNLFEFFSSKTPYEFWLTCIIIAFGLMVIILFLWGMRGTKDRRPEDVSRAMIVMTVITGSLILITAGYSTEQVAPAFGIFGTIVGYMLGRMSDTRGGATPTPPPGPPAHEPAPGPGVN
jgi:hypothetical protein